MIYEGFFLIEKDGKAYMPKAEHAERDVTICTVSCETLGEPDLDRDYISFEFYPLGASRYFETGRIIGIWIDTALDPTLIKLRFYSLMERTEHLGQLKYSVMLIDEPFPDVEIEIKPDVIVFGGEQ